MVQIPESATPEFSPEFRHVSEAQPDAINYMLRHGAAKVVDFLSPRSVAAVRDLDVMDSTSVSAVFAAAPEVATLASIFGTRGKHLMSAATYWQQPHAAGNMLLPHTDGDANFGVSFLLPTIGAPAYFAADTVPFTLFDNEDNAPRQFWTYQPGDLMLMRQTIFSVNDKEKMLGQAAHCGAASTVRAVRIIDIANPILELPFDTAA